MAKTLADILPDEEDARRLRSNEKPEPLKRVRARKRRDDAKQLKAFRDAVWLRSQTREYLATGWATGRCAHCKERVWPDVEPRGEVHHRIPRSVCTKAQRYDPDNGVLLCGAALNDCHGKAQRHEIDV